MPTRQQVLVGLLVAATLVTLALLWNVAGTVFFAITVAYVAYPLRQMLVDRGVDRRLAAGLCTLLAFGSVVVLITPVVWVLYRRRNQLLEFVRALPASFEFDLLGMTYLIELATVVQAVPGIVRSLALNLARAAPILGLKVFLFALLVYAVLLRPGAAPAVVFRTVPGQYHDVVRQLHERARDTLYAIYLLQGATAIGTFLIAYAVFGGLGYEGAFALAAIAGILQFVPVVGPSVLVALVALADLVAGDVTGAVLVLVFGLVFVGFLPDAVIRPKLSPYTAKLPGSLYFVGFTGGVLSIGPVGFIAGPLAVALFVETVELVADERTVVQRTFD